MTDFHHFPPAPTIAPGERPFIHLAHANGYPPECYRALVAQLSHLGLVFSYLSRPLQPDQPPHHLRDWGELADEMAAALLPLAAQRPLVGIGHSMGGMMTLIAAARHPTLFRALVVIDPVLFPPWLSFANGIVKALGLTDRLNPLIPATLRRRRQFASRDAMFANYRPKPVFARLSDAALRDYVDSMAVPQADGTVTLRYAPEWEAQVYRTMPHDGWRYPRRIRQPLLILRGEHTDTFFHPAAARLQRLVSGAVYHTVPDTGHLLPLEAPDVVGQHIVNFLAPHVAGREHILAEYPMNLG